MHVVGTAGHVDHGKSTLVRALTGIDPDRFEEEKRRGLTIDLGFAWCSLPSGREIGIIDVPGHERFIRNMLAGVGGIDAAIFVVAADEGWMPQSAEHLQILEFLDVRSGVVALTKCDAVSPEEVDLAHEDVSGHLRGTFLQDAKVVRVSGKTGRGLDELRNELDAVLAHTDEAEDRGRPRLFVDRSFTIAGAGTVVTGTLTHGALHVGDGVEVVPTGHHARVRSLQTHRRAVTEASPGSRVAANLVGLERAEVARGDAVVHPGQWRLSDAFAARLRTARDLRHQLTERGAYELYVGSAEVACDLKFLENRPQAGAVGATALVEVFTRRPLPIEVGDRFIIRDVGRRSTVAGGIVLDSSPGVIRRGDESSLARLRAREGVTRKDLALLIVSERRAIGADELEALSGFNGDVTDDLFAQGGTMTTSYLLAAGYEDELRRLAVEQVGASHRAQPLEAGMRIEELREALEIEPGLFEQLMWKWQPDTLVREGAVVRLPAHQPALDPEQRSATHHALDKLRVAGASPPSLADVGLRADLARALERTGELVFLTPEIAYPGDVWKGIERRIVELIASNGPVTVSQVREAVGTSRKYAVPLLEHLDATGITRRKGDVRELGPRGRELLNG